MIYEHLYLTEINCSATWRFFPKASVFILAGRDLWPTTKSHAFIGGQSCQISRGPILESVCGKVDTVSTIEIVHGTSCIRRFASLTIDNELLLTTN